MGVTQNGDCLCGVTRAAYPLFQLEKIQQNSFLPTRTDTRSGNLVFVNAVIRIVTWVYIQARAAKEAYAGGHTDWLVVVRRSTSSVSVNNG